jgi:predicted RNA-binding protein
MARETVAQRNARFDAERAAHLAAESSMYPTNLMNMLERAADLGYELTVKEAKFVVRDLHAHDQWSMALAYDTVSQEMLDSMTRAVDEEELRRMGEQAKAQAKAAALAKLSKEERELLGL